MDIRSARFPGKTSPRSSPRSITRPTAVGQSVRTFRLSARFRGATSSAALGVLGQASNRSQNLLARAPTQRFPAAPTRPCQRSPRWPLRRHIHRGWRPPCPRACRPRPGVSHRAQEGQGCAGSDVSGRRRAAEAPGVAQKPRTSLTIALTDTAASGLSCNGDHAQLRDDAGAIRH